MVNFLRYYHFSLSLIQESMLMPCSMSVGISAFAIFWFSSAGDSPISSNKYLIAFKSASPTAFAMSFYHGILYNVFPTFIICSFSIQRSNGKLLLRFSQVPFSVFSIQPKSCEFLRSLCANAFAFLR